MFKFFSSFLAVLAFTQLTYAQDFELGNAIVSGTGCPSGSAAVAISPDKKTISILFDKFSIEKQAGSPGGQAQCQVRIEVNNITPGFVLDTTTFDFRGFAQLPDGTIATLRTRGGAEGAGRDNWVTEQIASSGDFTITRVAQQSSIRKCKSRANDVIKLGVVLSLSPRGVLRGDGLITIDTADLGNDSGLNLGVALKECDSKSGKIKDKRREARIEQREERRDRRNSNGEWQLSE